MNRSYKSVQLIPFLKLPSASEMAELVVQNFCCPHGIPMDIVWGAFCKVLGATCRLISGFNPQSNGQTKRVNQDLESILRGVTVCHLACPNLVFVSPLGRIRPQFPNSIFYCDDFLHGCSGLHTCSTSSPRQGFAIPSVQANLRRYQWVWQEACSALHYPKP